MNCCAVAIEAPRMKNYIIHYLLFASEDKDFYLIKIIFF